MKVMKIYSREKKLKDVKRTVLTVNAYQKIREIAYTCIYLDIRYYIDIRLLLNAIILTVTTLSFYIST